MSNLGKGFGQFAVSALQTMQARSNQEITERKAKELDKYKMDLDVEYKGKLAEAAYEMEGRKTQEQLGRNIQQNTMVGKQFLDYAGRTTDPEDRENFTRMGTLFQSMSTLPSDDIIRLSSQLKTPGVSRADKEAVYKADQRDRVSNAWEQIVQHDPEEFRSPDFAANVLKQYGEGIDAEGQLQITGLVQKVAPTSEKWPEEIKMSELRYRARLAEIERTKLQSRGRNLTRTQKEHIGTLQSLANFEGDTVNQYLNSIGREATLPTFEPGAEGMVPAQPERRFSNISKPLSAEEKKQMAEAYTRSTPLAATLDQFMNTNPEASAQDIIEHLLSQDKSIPYETIKQELMKRGITQ